jgi:hypothetical protein
MDDLIDMTRDLNLNMSKTLKGKRRVSKADLKTLKRNLHNMYDKVNDASKRRRASRKTQSRKSRSRKTRSRSRKHRDMKNRTAVIYVPGTETKDEASSFKRTLLGLL